MNKDKFYNSFLFKIANTLAGHRQEYSLTLIITVVFGFLYSFKIWYQPAILFIFGGLLNAIYIYTLYRLFKIISLQLEKPIKLRFLQKNFGNYLLIFIDILITFTLCVLIYIDIINSLIIRMLLTIIFPFFLITAIYASVNSLE
ncbi:hypothetical protein ACFLSA_00165 [Bacteroidota bacterium]